MGARERAAGVRLMGFDVDGVLTDGTLLFGPRGEELKVFSSLDGHGLKLLREAGVTLALISGRRSEAVALRAAELGIARVHQGVEDKPAVLRALCAELGIAPGAAGYIGDDVVDLPVLGLCGFSAAPADAHARVRQRVDWVARARGGRGAVRELCEFVLEAQGRLAPLLARYDQA